MGLFGSFRKPMPSGVYDPVESTVVQRPLRRMLAFTGRSIDDVVNSPIAKREVLGYYKLHKQITRVGEVRDLEWQWNSVK